MDSRSVAVSTKRDGSPTFGNQMEGVRPLTDTLDRNAVMARVRRELLEEEIDEPARIDRFIVLSRLGAGAMGVVYAAYDPRLDRKVALKLLLKEGTQEAQHAHQRLLREAQTLARLSHANVVGVHEVGEVDGRVFIAMEFVDGQTLGRWLSEESRAWTDVLAKFTAAGSGLAAAHDAGLVHRDFKPENVLLDRRGDVRVADFGLARAADGDAARSMIVGVSTEDMHSELDVSLTRTGVLVGTPAYMAPEQYAAEPVGAWSDQFSFCVALFEALYGLRPFAGDSVPALITAIAAGEIQPTPAGNRVPGSVRRAVTRGLSATPKERWPDMRALLTALNRNPGRVWRRRLPIGAALSVGALGLAAWATDVRTSPATQPCSGLRHELVDEWSDDRRHDAEAALLATQHPAAVKAWQRIDPMMAEYSAAWVAARTDACEATKVKGTVSEAVLDRRILCLERARLDFVSAARRFVEADATVVVNADQITPRVRNIESCGEREVLETGVAPPNDPAVREEIAGIDAEVSEVRIMRLSGQLDTLPERSAALVERAKTVNHDPTVARVMVERGMVLTTIREIEPALEAFSQAVVAGERGRADLTRALALKMMARRATDLGRLSEARRLAGQAIAALARFDDDTSRVSELSIHGYIAEAEGDFVAATELYNQARLHAKDRHGDETALSLILVSAWASAALQAQVDPEVIEPVVTEAIDRTSELWGVMHPDLAVLYGTQANTRMRAGDIKGARAAIERAMSIRTSLVGRSNPTLTRSLMTYANVAYAAREYDQALSTYQRVIQTVERIQGADSLELPGLLHNVGLVLHKLDDLEGMLAADQRALQILTKGLSPDHARVAYAHYNLGMSYARSHDHEASLRHYRLAVKIFDARNDRRSATDARIAVTDALCELDRCGDAKRAATEAVAAALALGLEPRETGRAEFSLAKVVDATGDRAQAIKLARSAEQRLQADGRVPQLVEVIQAWVAKR